MSRGHPLRATVGMTFSEVKDVHSELHSDTPRAADSSSREFYPLTPGLVRVIEGHMRANAFGPSAIGSSGSSIGRIWFNWKRWIRDGRRHRVRWSKLEAVAAAIRIDPEILKAACLVDFETLENVASSVDEHLLRFVRAAEGLDQVQLSEAYEELLIGCLAKHTLHPVTYLALLDQLASDPTFPEKPPPTELTIHVDDDFESITFDREGVPRLQVVGPQLLWDCCCQVWPKKESRLCKIHSHPSGQAIGEVFAKGRVEIRWRGLSIRWRNTPQLWPPSVDTFSMMNALRHERSVAKSSSILDLGSGTGMLGLFAATRASKNGPVSLDLADWLLTPALYGAANYALNRQKMPRCALRTRIGMMDRWIGDALGTGAPSCDLVLCNPPYLPSFQPFRGLGQHTSVVSTDLLEHVITRASTYGRHVFVQYSSVADREVRRAALRGGLKLAPVGKDRLVPFRVRVALSEPRYIAALVMRGGLRRLKGHGHEDWHTLRLRRVKPGRQAT